MGKWLQISSKALRWKKRINLSWKNSRRGSKNRKEHARAAHGERDPLVPSQSLHICERYPTIMAQGRRYLHGFGKPCGSCSHKLQQTQEIFGLCTPLFLVDWLVFFFQTFNGGQPESCICSPTKLQFVLVQVKRTISLVVLPPSHTIITTSELEALNSRGVIPESSNQWVNTLAQIRYYLCFLIRLNNLSRPCLRSALAVLPAIAGSQ